ncbi:MAG TPA: sigma-70 family RNA polymerase sigma factor [Gemmatimonadaceae bacterium]
MVISDAAVVSRVRGGESDAFALLFERYYERCARLATRLLGDPDDAADAVQDAFIRAYLSLDSYQERDRFGSWLMCIVANRCRSTTDAARRRANVAGEWMRAHADLAHSTELPREGDHALAQHLDDALDTLPDATRSVVLRKYGEGLSYEEISADTGVAVSALKMRVARGSAQLRRTLVGAGITAATVALIFVTHTRETRQPRAATVVACDTLRAIMHDTLGAATRDSLLPPGRCDDNAQALSREQRLRATHEPPTKPEF